MQHSIGLLIDGLIAASLPAFLYIALQPGMILNFWMRFILIKFYYQKTRSKPARRHGRKTLWKLYLYKIMGGCVFCYGFWLSLAFGLFRYNIIEAFFVAFISVSFLYFFVFKLKD